MLGGVDDYADGFRSVGERDVSGSSSLMSIENLDGRPPSLMVARVHKMLMSITNDAVAPDGGFYHRRLKWQFQVYMVCRG